MNNGKRDLFDRFGLSAKKTNKPSGEKHFDEFLRVVERYVDSLGRPIGRDDILAKHESFEKLDGYIRALRSQGMIESSADDPNKYELTQQGRQWVQGLFPSSKFATRQWKKAKAKDKKHTAEFEPDSRGSSNGKPKRRRTIGKAAQDSTDLTPDDMSSKDKPNAPSQLNGRQKGSAAGREFGIKPPER